MDTKEMIMKCLAENIKKSLDFINDFEHLEEIRLRANKPIIIYQNKMETVLNNKPYPDAEDILLTLELMSDYSLYALEEELKNGYITLSGGHRVGITGKAIIDNGHIKTIKCINSLNIRLSHQIIGCADRIINNLYDGETIFHTIIISPPKCGKTTLLRDIVRKLSNGNKIKRGLTVGVVDERSEIGGCYNGVAQNDIGIRTDILDACPKAEGIMLLLRSMSPEVIAVDEIGRNEDIYAIEEILNAGIKLICTVHGKTLDDIRNKPVLSEIIKKNIFERAIILSNKRGIGTIEGIICL